MSRYAVFDALQDILVILDREARVRYGNQAAAIMLGTSAKRLSSGRELSQFITFDPPLTEIASITETTRMREASFQLAEGGTGWIQFNLQPQPELFATGESDRERWILSIRDVSVEKTLHVKYRGELDQKEVIINELREARAQLEDYSKGLEQAVNDRTSELRESNRLLKTILDSLGQGILVFGRDGHCLPVHSQVCQRLLGQIPTGLMIEDVLCLEGTARTGFEKWRAAVFDELLDFRDLVPLAPGTFAHSAGLEIALSYHPMRDGEGHLQGIVLVATDRTLEMKAMRKAERERELVSKVTQVARNRETFRIFVQDARKLLEELKFPDQLEFVEIARRVHTLKGAAGSFSLSRVAESCHALEDEMKPLKDGDRRALNRVLRNRSEKILGELDRELMQLSELLGPIGVDTDVQMIELPMSALREWSKTLISIPTPEKAREIGVQILKETSEKSAGASLLHLGSSLSETAQSLGRRLDSFIVENADLKIPAYFAQSLLASLVHAYRNSIFHGIESPDERRALGKAPGGKIHTRFERVEKQRKDWLSIDIVDDGRGVDPERVRAKLIEQGKATFAAKSDQDVIQAILRDDFSTANEVSEIAGRGVGLAAINSEVRRLGGTIQVTSEVGRGMSLRIMVPFPRSAQSDPSNKAA